MTSVATSGRPSANARPAGAA